MSHILLDMKRWMLGLSFLASMVAAVPKCAVAQGSLACDREGKDLSFYCDDSWQGGRSFYRWIQQNFDNVQYYRTFVTKLEKDLRAKKELYVMIDPPEELDTGLIRERLSNGAMMLVFDDSVTSLKWYQDLIHKTAKEAERGTRSATAFHINNNDDLPVYAIHAETRRWLKSVENDDVLWRLAFNHPVAIADDTKKALFGLDQHYFYTWSGEEEEGKLFVVRDDSWPINLMMRTMDNQKLLQAVMKWMCGEALSCHVGLFAPAFHIDNTKVSSYRRLEEWYKWMENRVEEIKNDMDNWKDERLISMIPWRLFFVIVLTVWSYLGLFLVFPIMRAKK